jgi:branched-chain amino acid transport system substrate-binding protein
VKRRTILLSMMAASAGPLARRAYAQDAAPKIRVGVLTDMAGPYAEIGGPGSVLAAQMAADDAGGHVNGTPVAVVSGDHQNKPDVAALIAREWYDQDHVDLIVDVPFSTAALAVQEIAREKKKMVIFTGAATERLTEQDCGPTTIHYVYDTYSMANVTGKALVGLGAKTWFFVTADYVGGIASNAAIMDVVRKAGGQILGEVRHPTNTADFSSYLLQAQASKADVVVFSDAGQDLVNAIKQANEFGLAAGGQRLAAALMFLSDVRGMGLATAQNMEMATSFYWDYDDQTRAWSKRFRERFGKAPNDNHAGVYSAVSHYLAAARDLRNTDAMAVMGWMRSHPLDDFFVRNGRLLPNGRLMKDMYLAQVKKPGESSGPDDLLSVIKVVPADQAFRPIGESVCPLVAKPTNEAKTTRD